MRVLTVASQKGGSGKTTLAGHLAVQADRAGMGPIVVIDLDPQAALTGWWQEREPEEPAMAETSAARFVADIELLRRQGYRLAVIDTPPAIEPLAEAIAAVSDLVLIPTRPSPHDIRAAGSTVALCERADLPLLFVMNGATPDSRINGETALALSQYGTVAPVTLHHRSDFASSMIDGRTVMEADPGGHSAAEVAALWDFLGDRIETKFRRTVFMVPGGGVRPHAIARARMKFGRRVAS
ncbi:ParA family protein [Erythrobacter sp. LQ02-29]|uniref:AAA family ATPase n=1 Tax=Erythrobacter sp. LQ02-29 TaxID=2920384 RepID=UPI001F4E0774|nr:ParA family protein [Erythrobacter sp. LQ02-29]